MMSHAKLFLERNEDGQCWAIPINSDWVFTKLWQISTKMEAWKDKYTMNSVSSDQ